MKLPAFTIIAMFVLIACRAHSSGKKRPATLPTSAPAPVIERAGGSFRLPPAPVLPVKQGPAPLVYIVESGGPIRIVQMETGTTLGSAFASPGNIVSVDESAGVRVGRELLMKGPLPAGRTYGIYLENQDENQMESQRVRPGK